MEPDVEAQRGPSKNANVDNNNQNQSGSTADRPAPDLVPESDEAVTQDEVLPPQTTRQAGTTVASTSDAEPASERSSRRSSAYDEESGLFDFAEKMRSEQPVGEPWYMEMTRLRRLYFLHLNNQLAQCKKRILEKEKFSDEDMVELKGLLRDQADAVRDFEYIRSLDILPAGQKRRRVQQCEQYFPEIAHSSFADVRPFETENYRYLSNESKTLEPFSGQVREFFRAYLPVQLSWTEDEKSTSPAFYAQRYRPQTLSPMADRFARFIGAMVGTLFILVPMYIMALHQNRTINLVTTSIAVVLYTLLCSVTLKISYDQTLSATVGYAAVLTVFVGLTTSVNPS